MAGYVVHTLKKKMKRVSFPKKDEVITCLGELEENGIAGDIANKVHLNCVLCFL